MIAKEQVISSLQSSENDKISVGLEKYLDQGLINAIYSIHQWFEVTLPLSTLGALQMYISRDKGHGTERIFNFLNSLTFNRVAHSINELMELGEQSILAWLDRINPDLHERIVNGETQPLIICWPPLFEAGSVLDGNHRLLAMLAYQDRAPNYQFSSVFLGIIPPEEWVLKFAKGFARSRLSLKTRISVGLERLNLALNNPGLKQLTSQTSFKTPSYSSRSNPIG